MRSIKLKIKNAVGITTIQENQKILDKKLNELNYAMVFDFAVKDSAWFKKQTLNPGRWAMGFPALYILYRVLNDLKPKNIIEFGLGESTKLTYQFARHHAASKLTVVEHNKEWTEFFSNEIFDVKEFLKLIPVKKESKNGFECNVYDNLIEQIKTEKYNLIIVDGPVGTPAYSRYQIAEMVQHDLIADDFVILLDDANRQGEQQTLADVYQLLHKKNIKFCTGIYSGEKDMQMICSENYAFLATL